MRTIQITRVPLRVSLAGGGCDFPEYYTMPGKMCRIFSLPIDKYIWITLSERFDSEVFVGYRATEIAQTIHDIKHPLVRTIFEAYHMPETHLEVHLIANLSGNGTGLGSSSALAVGLVQACRRWQGHSELAWQELAKQAWAFERASGAKVGIQDHLPAASYLNYFEIDHTNLLLGEAIPAAYMQELIDNLLLFHIENRTIDGKVILRHISEEPNEAVMDALSKQAESMRQVVNRKTWDEVGGILHEGWLLKKKLHKRISNDTIDEAYAEAIRAGALGGKLCGAGGGGFLLLYATPGAQEAVRKAMKGRGYRELTWSIA